MLFAYTISVRISLCVMVYGPLLYGTLLGHFSAFYALLSSNRPITNDDDDDDDDCG